jgi:hypothetical protein
MGAPVTLVDDSGKSLGPFPNGAVPLAAPSGNVANAVAAATLVGVASKTAYIAGFEVTGAGATAGLPVSVTVTGVLGGPLAYTYCAAAGVLVANQPLIVEFNPPLPASAANTNIVVSCPALGAGNTNNTVNAHGYNL